MTPEELSKLKTEELNEMLAKVDQQLHSMNDQMSAVNTIRALFEDGYEEDYILSYIREFLAIAIKTKAGHLKQIEALHLALAERHMKLTNNWEFCYIGEKEKTK
jgi:hypothetical protein